VRYLELSTTQTPGMLWQNLDPARMAKQFGISLLPLVMELQGPAEPNLLRDWVEPDFGREQHISYMVQWYSLAALTVVLWLTLNWRKA
jgi:cytochrome oxidase assembly protein ShyY1